LLEVANSCIYIHTETKNDLLAFFVFLNSVWVFS
jgi:hypothetical protein